MRIPRAAPVAHRFGPQLAAAAIFLFVSLPLFAVEPPLTLAAAQRQAVERSRQVTAQDSAVSASREMAIAAGQLPDPMLKLGVQDLPVTGPDRFSLVRDNFTMRQIGVTQEFTRRDKRQARSERFEREADKSVAQKAVTVAAIQRDTAIAWLDRYYAEAMAGVVREQAQQARAEIEAADAAYRAGRGMQADVFTSRAALVTIDDRASETARRVRTATIALARWIGDSADAPLAEKPDLDTLQLDTQALDRELKHDPRLVLLAKQEEIAAADVKVAETNKRADWSVEIMYSVLGPSYSNMMSLSVSVPLQWDQRHRQNRELASKLALLDQARSEREDALRTRVAEVRAMIAEWENDRERFARFRNQLVPLAQQRTQATLAAYRGGKTALVDVLSAHRNEIDVRLQVLQLELEAARMWAQLNFLFPEDASYARQPMLPKERS